jgi:pimeloyl-ACP methyl ester carboxylesterase
MKDTSQHITNRYGLRLFVRTFIQPHAGGLVFIAHGLSDNHATPNMLMLRETFLSLGYSVVVWDATNSSWGQSEGRYEDATFTKHYHDLEDIISWSKSQPWRRHRFTLAGYSLGGIAVGTYASRHSHQVDKLVLLAPVVSGEYLRRAIPWPILAYWRLKGSITQSRKYRKRYSWELIRDGLNYDLINWAEHLTMPVLMIGASRDTYIRPKFLRRLCQAIPHDNKRLVIIPRTGHRFLKARMHVQPVVEEWIKGP